MLVYNGGMSLTKGVSDLSSGLNNILRAIDTVASATNKLDPALKGNLAALDKKPAVSKQAAKAAPAYSSTCHEGLIGKWQ